MELTTDIKFRITANVIAFMIQRSIERDEYGRMGYPNWTSLHLFLGVTDPKEIDHLYLELKAVVEGLPEEHPDRRQWMSALEPTPELLEEWSRS